MTAAAGFMLIPSNARLGANLRVHRSLLEQRGRLLAAPPAEDVTVRHVLTLRLDQVGERLFWTGRQCVLARCTQIALLTSVALMLVSLACIGAAALLPMLSLGAVTFFALGGIAMGVAMFSSILEIGASAKSADTIPEGVPPPTDRPTTAM